MWTYFQIILVSWFWKVETVERRCVSHYNKRSYIIISKLTHLFGFLAIVDHIFQDVNEETEFFGEE